MEVFDAYSGFIVDCIIVCLFSRVLFVCFYCLFYFVFITFFLLYPFVANLYILSRRVLSPGVSSLPSPTETAVGQKAFPSLMSQPLSREPEDLVVPKVA